MARQWRNWSGDQRCRPASVERPRTRAELIESVGRAADAGQTVRVAASGHSFTDIACTDGLMLRLEGMNRILDVDRDSGLVTVEAGIELGDLSQALDGSGLAMENMGDIDRQTLAGAISTGTHGTGARFRNISSQVEGMELVLADGSVAEIDGSDRDALRAARVGLGALGVIASVTLRTISAFTISRIDSVQVLSEVLDRLDDLVDANDHFEFYAFPNAEQAILRESTRTDEPPRPPSRASFYVQEVMLENWLVEAYGRAGRRIPRAIPGLARFVSKRMGGSRKTDRSFRVYASQRRVRFTEMEYGIPRENAVEAIRRVLELAERPELRVSFPIEVRFVAADDALLSPSHERDTCYVAVHMFKGMPWEAYFRGVEAIMAEYQGRPHWGKRHFQTAETLAGRYPGWDAFRKVRSRLDPEGVFRNDYTDRVLGRP
jgi:L-gulono-1,4-lactone dehydrogenase